MSERYSNSKKNARRSSEANRRYYEEEELKQYRKRSNKGTNQKRKKKKSKAPVVILIFVMLILIAGAGYLALDKLGLIKPEDGDQQVVPTATPYAYSDEGTAFAELLKNTDQNEETEVLTGEKVSVDNLSITEGLDETWLNVLLLGVDARNATTPARSDTMIICSINQETGDVKLSTIMRDTDVSFEGHPGTRINSAYYYGGPELAIKVVNEYFGMNIRHYVCVDFAGFAEISEVLGGITVDITENEMTHINKNVLEQYKILWRRGDLELEQARNEYYGTELNQYGANVHLNGMQTLGYARIRKLDSDYARAERQRKVLNKLMEGLQNADATKLVSLYLTCMDYFTTNLKMNEIVNIAVLILNRVDFTSAEEMRLPVAGSYKEEKRNDDARLYDMDIETNIRELHNFIYR